MKNYDELTNDLLKRRDAYVATKKKKNRINHQRNLLMTARLQKRKLLSTSRIIFLSVARRMSTFLHLLLMRTQRLSLKWMLQLL